MKKAHLREINRINASIPKDLLARIMIKKPIAPIAKEMMERALANPEEVKDIVSPEELEKYRVMLASGQMDQMEETPDPEVEKLIEDHLDKEFAKARKLGLLPPPQKFPKLKLKSKKNYVKDIKEHRKILPSKENN